MSQGFSSRGIDPRYRTRSFILFSLFLLTILIYGYVIFSLQIIHGDAYQKKATQLSRRGLPITAQRGEVFDRTFDEPLVINVPSFAISIIPAEMDKKNIQQVFSRLSKLLSIPLEEITQRIPPHMYYLYQPVEIKTGVHFETIAYIAEHIEDFKGVTWSKKPIRRYIESKSISHIVGYVGDITREELQVLYNQGYKTGDIIGKSGIEKQYDNLLRGKDGMHYRTVDVHGRSVKEVTEEIPPVTGNTLVLTIDMNIQKVAEEALGERMGSVVVLKPSTGEIIAMVSYPWYDPNIFSFAKDNAKYNKLSMDSRYPFLNRAVQSSYAPASAFKVIMTTAVLAENAFDPAKKITCDGHMFLGGLEFSCHKKTGHGPLNLYEGLAESCDIYFWQIGLHHLGVDVITDYSRVFGLGTLTKVDLPGETNGLVPTPQYKEARYNVPWVGGDTLNISIGQGDLLVTPLQMANMIAMVVNEGKIYKPHVLKEIRDPVSGDIIDTVKPEVLHSSSVESSIFRQVKDAMRLVITEGTAKVVITTDAVQIAGKTGTGEVGYEDKWSSWFAAYAPYDTVENDDCYVVVVNVEPENDWEWWAPKAANIIFQAIFANQTYDEAIDTLRWGWLRNKRSPE